MGIKMGERSRALALSDLPSLSYSTARDFMLPSALRISCGFGNRRRVRVLRGATEEGALVPAIERWAAEAGGSLPRRGPALPTRRCWRRWKASWSPTTSPAAISVELPRLFSDSRGNGGKVSGCLAEGGRKLSNGLERGPSRRPMISCQWAGN